MSDRDKLLHCPALTAIGVIRGKWKTRVLWLLRERRHHFGELRTLLPGVSAKVLTEQLRQLQAHGIIVATPRDIACVTHVFYEFTGYGRTLIPVLDLLGDWGLGFEARSGADAPDQPSA